MSTTTPVTELPKFDNTLGALLIGGLLSMSPAHSHRPSGASCLFARRIFRLSHGNYFLTAGIVAISLVDLTCGIIITIRAFSITSWTDLSAISHLFYLNFASGCAGDVYVALALSWYLWQARTGFARTDGLVRTLMLYAINTGAITAGGQYIIMPTNFIFVIFYLMLSKRASHQICTNATNWRWNVTVYVNSYLATLNARDALFERGGIVSVHLSQMGPRAQFTTHGPTEEVYMTPPSTARSARSSTKRSEDLTVNVETEVDTKGDPFMNYNSPTKCDHPYASVIPAC
ncbi:hypothetical protein HWV62_7417 [Athelia sp. TMB]|nr:hypothetical protein HWV62_7417 [Athelia sp. TMB]